MNLLCYGKPQEKICLHFFPCKNSGENITWEEWHIAEPLVVYISDYRPLLLPYFNKVFPLIDPANGKMQESFDECWDNWIGFNDWNRITDLIKKDIPFMQNEQEITFFHVFLTWIEKQWERFDIIVVDGNL